MNNDMISRSGMIARLIYKRKNLLRLVTVINELEAAPSVHFVPAERWVPVEERLPEREVSV